MNVTKTWNGTIHGIGKLQESFVLPMHVLVNIYDDVLLGYALHLNSVYQSPFALVEQNRTNQAD